MVWEYTLRFLSKMFPPWHGMLLKERLFATPPHSHETTNIAFTVIFVTISAVFVTISAVLRPKILIGREKNVLPA